MADDKKNPPLLPTSYKHRYPFRLATTSFIYPDHYVPNVEKLGPYVDEIELLFFESLRGADVAREREIDQLARLAERLDLTYNVHLPTDVSLTDADVFARRKAVAALSQVIRLTAPLSPSTFTLHLPFAGDGRNKASITAFQSRAMESMAALCRFQGKPDRFSVENLDYPLAWALPVIEALSLSVCIDVGHLLVNGFSVTDTCRLAAGHISAFHLMGAADGRDHLALDRLSANHAREIVDALQAFNGVVSIEVFNFDDLARSLLHLEHLLRLQPAGI